MNSGPVDHSKHPADPAAPPRSVWLRLARLGISIVILWGLWLFYPLVSIRIAAARVASFYEAVIDPGTGQITGIGPHAGNDFNKVRAWEERLESQELSRLLAILPSRDPIGVVVVSRAIDRQLRLGRPEGWAGTRKPAQPLDSEAVEQILHLLEQELPPPATESLLLILNALPPDSTPFHDSLMKATEHREPLVREFSVRILESRELDSDETWTLIERFARDADSRVRSRLVNSLTTMIRAQRSSLPSAAVGRVLSRSAAPATTGSGTQTQSGAVASPASIGAATASNEAIMNPPRIQRLLLAALQDDSQTVRSAAIQAIDILDLESDEVTQAVVKCWSGASDDSRWSLFNTLMDRLTSGQIRRLPLRLADAMVEYPPASTVGRRRDFLDKIVRLPDIPVARQWQLIEAELVSSEMDNRAQELRNALFSSVNLEPYVTVSAGMIAPMDWKQFRERFRPSALEAKPRLLEWATEAIRSDEEKTVLSGASLLAEIAPEEADRLTPLLSHSSVNVRAAVLRSLVPTPDQLPRLWELLKDQNLRAYAGNALIRYPGPMSAAEIDLLCTEYHQGRLYISPEEFFRRLERETSLRTTFIQFLSECLNSEHPHVRNDVVQALRKRKEDVHEVWPHLVEGIRAGRLGSSAAALVIEAGEPIDDPETARRLLHLILDSYWNYAPNAHDPADCRELLPKLTKLCATEFTSTDFVDVVADLLRATNEESQRAAIAKRYSDLPIDATAALPRLGELLKDERWEVLQGVEFLLAAWGTKATPAAGLLIERLNDSEAHVRIAAAQALGAIGPDAGPATAAALAQAAKTDKLSAVQVTAIEALAKMKQHIKANRATLDSLAKHSDPMVRRAATKILNRLAAEGE